MRAEAYPGIAESAPPLTADADRAAFARDGVVCLRGVFAHEWIELAARGIERDLKHPGHYFSNAADDDSSGRYLQDFWASFHVPELRDFGFRSPAAAIAGELSGADTIAFLEDNWFLKEPGTTSRTPWHQDEPAYDLEGEFLSVWMPLDPVTPDSGLEFVRGSHLWDRLFVPADWRSQLPQGGAGRINGIAYEITPDIEAGRGDHDIVSWALEPGDCLVFSSRTLHGAPATPAGGCSVRRLSTRWAGPGVRYRHKGVPWSEFLADHGLADGAPIASAKFPIVWRRDERRGPLPSSIPSST